MRGGNASWRAVGCVAALVGGSVLALEERAQPPEEGGAEEADALLREMSEYLGGLQAFTVVAASSTEVVLESGQKLEIDATSSVAVRRPDRLRADRLGEVARLSLYYDGRSLTLMGRRLNVYSTAPAPPTIEETIDFARDELGLDIPGADLLATDAYSTLGEDAVSAMYVGKTVVDGVECHHLAFRGEEVDWQIWIDAGPRPLPRKYVITSKEVVGAPEFTVSLREWNVDPKLSEKTFEFEPPPGAEEIEFLGLQEAQERPVPGRKGEGR